MGAVIIAVLLVCIGLWVLLFREPAPVPAAYWQIPLVLAMFLTLLAALLLPTFRSVRVDDRGLWVGGRLAVQARRIGTVEVLDGGQAWFAGLAASNATRPRVRWRNNLYGGGYGWGAAVRVEQVRPGSPSVWWLIPGPRVEELAAALRAVRDAPAGAAR